MIRINFVFFLSLSAQVLLRRPLYPYTFVKGGEMGKPYLIHRGEASAHLPVLQCILNSVLTEERIIMLNSVNIARSRVPYHKPLLRLFSVVLIFSLILLPASAFAAPSDNSSGFKTSQPPMLTAVMSGVTVTPLLTVGDVLPSGFRFEAIPDGISLRTRGQGRVDLFVNHETSKVPFPYVQAAPTAANGENDFDNAQVSRLILNQQSAG